jgi:hypothetical protein
MFNTETIITTDIVPESEGHVNRRLGKSFVKGHPKALIFSDYLSKTVVAPPTYDFYKGKKPIPVHDTGNNEFGCCTIASQAIGAEYLERIEQRRTIQISRDQIVNTYFNMCERVYGSRADEGAYEIDALNNWRNADFTFRDYKGRPMTIDAYTKINHANIEEVKKALFLSAGHIIKVCFALPLAWASAYDNVWDIPEGQKLVGQWTPYSWGGHSMLEIAKYDQWGVTLPSTWNQPAGKISWRAFATYCDEAYLVIDSVNQWKKRLTKKELNFGKLVSDVNMVSDVKIAA